MSTQQKRIFWPIVLVVGLALGALAFASAHAGRRTMEGSSRASQNPAAAANPRSAEYVRAGRLWPQLRWKLKAFGDRLEKPGKERVTLAGTLLRSGDVAPVPVLLVLQFPDRLRLVMQVGVQSRVITFNGHAAQGQGGPPLNPLEEDLIETLVYDTAEHFFGAQSQSISTRFLGEHFRPDGGTGTDYVGPFYDVYQITERIGQGVSARSQTKVFCFNSDTHLLERISYDLERNGSLTSVEIQLSGWRQVQEQQVPSRIARWENGQAAWTLTLNSAALSAGIEDGAFGT